MKDITISPAAARILMDCSDGNASRLYIYYLAYGNTESEGATKALSISADAYSAALSFLIAKGLCPSPKRITDDRPPEYTEAEISSAVKEDISFKSLINYTEQKFGRILSCNEISALLRLYRWFGMSCQIIMLIISHCSSVAAEKGAGRRLSVSQIQSVAYKWLDEGIDTVEKADEYLLGYEKQKEFISKVCTALRLSSPTATVENYIKSWAEWGVSVEMIERAADITVTSQGVMNYRYINGIIRKWHNCGYYTISEVIASEGNPTPRDAGTSPSEQRSKDDNIEVLRRMKEKASLKKNN